MSFGDELDFCESGAFGAPGGPLVVSGAGSLARLGEFVSGRVLLVTDAGVVAAGILHQALKVLEGCEIFVYDEVRENPSEVDVEAAASFARGVDCEMVVALGGGSVIDTAKGVLFLLAGGGVMSDYVGHGELGDVFLPLVAVPTTAGTGSEVQSFAVLMRGGEQGGKMACGDAGVMPKVAILDALLTESLPLKVARLSALDALSHALESLVCVSRSEASMSLSRGAFARIESVIEPVLTGDASVEERGVMLVGAAMAGRAIEESMLGGAHAAANALTRFLGVAHGAAVWAVLPSILRFNAVEVGEFYDELRDDLVEWVEKLGRLAELKRVVVPEGMVRELAEEAAGQWTGTFNPRPLGVEEFVEIFEGLI